MSQRVLFDLDPSPPERDVCISCGALEAYPIEEAATFKDKGGGTPCVSVQWHCDACGSSCLTLREQESPWIRAVWKLGPAA